MKPYADSRAGYEACTGCNICVLPCPVWKETHDMSLTLAGRAKALQGGAKASDLAASLEACVLCGACEPVCPVEIDTIGMTLDLRAELMREGLSPLFSKASDLAAEAPAPGSGTASAGAWRFLPGRALRARPSLLEKAAQRLKQSRGASLAGDDGDDIAIAIEAGLELFPERLERFLAPLRGAQTLVVAEGLLHRHLRGWLKGTRVIGLGEALLEKSTLGPADFYVIETRGYHADFKRLVIHYDALRVASGCMMNLDLQRAAIPTGAMGLQRRLGAESVGLGRQTAWILEGRKPGRVIVESAADLEAFDGLGLPLLHLAEAL